MHHKCTYQAASHFSTFHSPENEWMAMLMGEKKRCHGLRVWLTSLCTTLNKMTEYTNIRYCICYWVKCLFVYDLIFFVICAVMAAASIANIVKSSLGPVGLDKMLVDDIGVSRIFFSVFLCIKNIYIRRSSLLLTCRT